MTRTGRTASSRPGASAVYLKKAMELKAAMAQAVDERRWNAAGVLGVHAAISAADALASKRIGRHSTGQSHDDAVLLVRDLGLPDAGRRADQLKEIISWKHVAAYEDRELSESEGRTLAKQVARFIDWVVLTIAES